MKGGRDPRRKETAVEVETERTTEERVTGSLLVQTDSSTTRPVEIIKRAQLPGIGNFEGHGCRLLDKRLEGLGWDIHTFLPVKGSEVRTEKTT